MLTATDDLSQVLPVDLTPQIQPQSYDQRDNNTVAGESVVTTTQPLSGIDIATLCAQLANIT